MRPFLFMFTKWLNPIFFISVQERKNWIPVRPKPRRCKKDKNFRKKSSSKLSTQTTLPTTLSSSQEIPSTASSLVTRGSSLTSATVRVFCDLNLSSPTESTSSGGSGGSQSVDSGISSQESLFADCPEDYTPDSASQISNDTSTTGRKRTRDDDGENIRDIKVSISPTFFEHIFRTNVFFCSLALYFFGERILAQKLLVKCWCHWLKVSCLDQNKVKNINSESRTEVRQAVISETSKEDSFQSTCSSSSTKTLKTKAEIVKTGPSTSTATSLQCTVCCMRPKEAAFVHGNISHQKLGLYL